MTASDANATLAFCQKPGAILFRMTSAFTSQRPKGEMTISNRYTWYCGGQINQFLAFALLNSRSVATEPLA
jgi:hypothetical protein